MARVYCLKKKKETDELHLFECEGKYTSCNCSGKSMCGKMNSSDQSGSNLFTCEDENETRLKAAKIGREVCGDCIRNLYKTY